MRVDQDEIVTYSSIVATNLLKLALPTCVYMYTQQYPKPQIIGFTSLLIFEHIRIVHIVYTVHAALVPNPITTDQIFKMMQLVSQ